MTRTIANKPHTSQASDTPTLNEVIAAIRSLWKTVEQASEKSQPHLKQEIAVAVDRLKSKIEKSLRVSAEAFDKERLLFERALPPVPQERDLFSPDIARRFPDPTLRVYAKDLAEHAVKHLPKLASCRSIEEIRKYLIANLRFNSQATRRRNASYLISRYFPGEIVHADLPAFAAAVEGKPALGEVLFYLTCRSEKIVALVAEEVVFPSLVEGGVGRTRISDYVQAHFPNSKSAQPVGSAIVHTYQVFGLAAANRTRLNVTLREGSLASFAYVLHLEFPEPGMHSFEKMFNGPMHKWLLWDQEWMIRQLYRLREAGLLSKVSEIDRLRQFTTKYTLADAVQHIVALAQESSQ